MKDRETLITIIIELYNCGWVTEDIVNHLTGVGVTPMSPADMKKELVIEPKERIRKSQAKNIIKSARKQMGIFKPLPKGEKDRTNFAKQKELEAIAERASAAQKEINEGLKVIQANHSDAAVGETIENQMDRIIQNSEVTTQSA